MGKKRKQHYQLKIKMSNEKIETFYIHKIPLHNEESITHPKLIGAYEYLENAIDALEKIIKEEETQKV